MALTDATLAAAPTAPAAASTTLAPVSAPDAAPGVPSHRRPTPPQPTGFAAPDAHPLGLTVNGVHHQLTVEPWTTLLDLLRDQLDLTGSKKGCDHGQCGACTVLVDDRRINACLSLAVMCDGSRVTTIEGLAEADGRLHPLQQAFIECDAFQCGYCTPGQICSAAGLAHEGRARSAADIRELMSGNLCRCGAYPQIVQAIGSVLLGPRFNARKVEPGQHNLPGTAPT